jgi:hypothetical protein
MLTFLALRSLPFLPYRQTGSKADYRVLLDQTRMILLSLRSRQMRMSLKSRWTWMLLTRRTRYKRYGLPFDATLPVLVADLVCFSRPMDFDQFPADKIRLLVSCTKSELLFRLTRSWYVELLYSQP